MVNLLPEPNREVAAIEFRFRLASVFCLGLAGSFAVATLLLLPAYFIAGVMRGGIEGQAQNGVSAEVKKTQADFAAQEQAAVLLFTPTSAVAQTARPSLLLAEVGDARPKGVRIASIQYQSFPAKQTLQIDGEAPTREILISYKEALGKIARIKNVDLPLDDLTKPLNNTFTITLTFSTSTSTH